MKTKLVSGIIYRIYDSSDTDKVISIITTRGEKESLLSKGVKKQSSRKSHSIDMGNYVSMSVVEGYAVPIVSEISLRNEFLNWKKEYVSLVALQFLCEVLDKFLYEENSDPTLFTLFYETLQLHTHDQVLYLVSIFLLKLLYQTGYISDLAMDIVTQETIVSDSVYHVWGEIGYTGSESAGARKQESRIFKTQRFILQTNLSNALRVQLQSSEITAMLKLHLDWIEVVIGRELKSKKILYGVL